MVHSRNVEEGWTGVEGVSDMGLGTLLRTTRESRGLTREEVFELTRLRPNVVEALENEEWGSLPSPPFVKGFLRSYARVLKLDEEKVLELYQENFPSDVAAVQTPRKKGRRFGKRFLLCLIVLFCAGAGILLGGRLGPQIGILKTIPTDKEAPPNPVPPERAKPEPVQPHSDPVAKTEPSSPLVPASPEKVPDQVAEDRAAPPPGSDPARARSSVKETPPPPAVATEEARPTVPPPEEGDTKLTLRGDVRERTWVKIIVDGGPPKEFILRPGSHPEWKAQKGFDLLIGNAGGLDLELNGRQLNTLGSPGQVVRVRLPDDLQNRGETGR